MDFQTLVVRLLVILSRLPSKGQSANGDWRMEYPPWGEPDTPTAGSPQIWFPLIGPFTRNSCFPSRYLSMRIAVNHINRRDSTFCPAIATLKNKFEFAYSLADSNANGVGAASAVLRFLSNTNRRVKVVLGPNSSGSSMSMSNILAVFKIPHISWAATNALLSNKADYPMFFRVVAPDSQAMRALAGFMAWQGWMKTNIAYFDADYQSGQALEFSGPAQSEYNIEVHIFKMPNSGKGGAAISPTNIHVVQQTVSIIRETGVRVCVVSAINEEAYGFFKLVYDAEIFTADGWIWLGTDGIAGNQLAGDASRLKYFVGSIFVQASGAGPAFTAYEQRWTQLMPNTSRPEFTDFDLCVDSTSENTGVCMGNEDFKGWKDDVHGLQLVCKSYVGLAYDAVVTLAIVADRILTKGIAADAMTNEDWLAEMRSLKDDGFFFDCLTGVLSFNENQERDMPFGFNNWQPGSLNFVEVAVWDVLRGYRWNNGVAIYWPSGANEIISGTPPTPRTIPTGMPPACTAGQIYNNTLLQCVVCPVGRFHDSSDKSVCSKCTTNTYADNEGMTSCKDCAPGYEATASEAHSCSPCQPGKFSIGGHACHHCEKGTASNASHQASCAVCLPGRFAGELGSVVCTECHAGSFSEGIKEEKCIACTVGKYAERLGSTACAHCGVGKYQSSMQATACADCLGTAYVTDIRGATSPDQCTCASGFYLNRRRNECVECESLLGYTCLGGLGPPLVSAGFYGLPKGDVNGSLMRSNAFSEMMIWRCSISDNCDGDRAMGECPPHMRGYGCSACEDGYAHSLDHLSCNSCDASGYAGFAASVLVVLPSVYMLHILNRPKYSPIVTSRTIIFGLGSVMVTFLQLVAIMMDLTPLWPSWYKRFGDDYAGITTVDISFAKPSCSLGHSFIIRFLTKMTAPTLLIVGLLVDVLVINVVPSMICPSVAPRLKMPEVANTAGVIVHALFVVTCKSTFSFVECARQPSAPATLVVYPDIECWSREHNQALPFFIFGVLVYVVGTWSYFLWLNVNAMHLHNASTWRYNWRRALPFLIGKWKPSRWYWAQIYLTRNLLISLIVVIVPDDGYFQLFLFMVCSMVPGFLTAAFQPWRHAINNQVDILVTILLAFICSASSPLLTVESIVIDESRNRANAVIMICVVLAVALFFSYFSYLLLMIVIGKSPETQDEKHIAILTTTLSALARALDAINDSSEDNLRQFIANIEPSERKIAHNFCMLTDQFLTKGMIKNVVKEKMYNNEHSMGLRAPGRLIQASHRVDDQHYNDIRTEVHRVLSDRIHRSCPESIIKSDDSLQVSEVFAFPEDPTPLFVADCLVDEACESYSPANKLPTSDAGSIKLFSRKISL